MVKPTESPLLQNPDYGSMVSTQHADLVRYLVEDAIDRGAQIIRVNPGSESFSGQTRKIPPTLIVEVADEMAVLRLPILGPVLAVRAYRNLDEVVEHATRGTDLGSVCWFDTDVGRAGAMIPRLSPRRAWLNGAPPLGSLLATVLPPLFTGDIEAGGGTSERTSGKFTVSHPRIVDGACRELEASLRRLTTGIRWMETRHWKRLIASLLSSKF